MFLTPTDFTGKYELHKGMYDTAKLQIYINKYEIRYLKEMLGVALYNQFISDLTSGANPVPQSPNFIKLFYAFSEDVNYNILDSDGMLEMLKGFIYFEYSKDAFMQQTTYGGVQQTAENSKVLNSLQTMIYARYNEAIRTYRAIQDYVLLNHSPLNLPTFYELLKINVSSNLVYGAFNQSYVADAYLLNKGVKQFELIGIVGNGYPVGQQNNVNCSTITGSGSGMKVNYEANLLGVPILNTIKLVQIGSGYEIGDVVQLDGSTLQFRQFEITDVYPTSSGSGMKLNVRTCKSNGIDGFSAGFSGLDFIVGQEYDLVYSGGVGVGTGGKIRVLTLDNNGYVASIEISDEGTGYSIGDSLETTIGASLIALTPTSVFLTPQVFSVRVYLNNVGTGYQPNQLIGVPNINGFMDYQDPLDTPKFQICELPLFEKGNYSLFKGRQKGMAYWI
jgi:hypothetical protein